MADWSFRRQMILLVNPSDLQNQFTNAQLLIHTLHILLIMELYIILFILTITQSIQLNLPHSLTLSPSSLYHLQASDAQGPVTYRIDWLPLGITLNGDQIQVHSSTIEGVYAVRVWATDALGAVDMKIIAIRIEQQQPQKTPEQVEPQPPAIQKTDIEMKVENQSVSIFSANNNEKQENIISDNNQQQIAPQPQELPSSNSELKMASQRHQNAIKAITNLLHIIDREKTKKSQIKHQLEKDIKNYEMVVQERKYVGLEMGSLERRAKQKQQDIAHDTVTIQNIKEKLHSLTQKKKQKEAEKSKLLAENQQLKKTKLQLTGQLTAILQAIQQQHKKSTSKSLQCQSHHSNLIQSTHQLNDIKTQHQQLEMQQQLLQKLVTDKQKNVKELRKQLEQAQNQLLSAEASLNDTLTQQRQVHIQLMKEKKTNHNHEDKATQCQAQHQQILNNIEQLKDTNKSNIQTMINKVKASIDSPAMQSLASSISYLSSQIDQYTDQLNNTQTHQQSLRLELEPISKQLNSIYVQINDLNGIVDQLHKSVQQLNQSYREQSKIIDEATLNLQKARSQEIRARANLESIMSSLSDSIPYVIVTKQSPMKQPITQRISSSSKNSCDRHGGESKVRGKIIAIHENGFDIKLANGFIVSIKVDKCTKLSRNKGWYEPKLHDEVIVHGRNKSWFWVASEIICVK